MYGMRMPAWHLTRLCLRAPRHGRALLKQAVFRLEAFCRAIMGSPCCAGILRKLHIKGLGGFAVAPGGGPHLAAYVPEAKGTPGALAQSCAAAGRTQISLTGRSPASLHACWGVAQAGTRLLGGRPAFHLRKTWDAV